MSSPTANARPALANVIALQWRTRETTHQLLHAFIAGFGIALASGVLLWLDAGGAALTQVLLVVHLVAGVLGVIFFVVFLGAHLKDGREPWQTLLFPLRLVPELRWDPYARKRLHGHALMWCNVLLLVSGLVIAAPALAYLLGKPATLPYGASHWLLRLHEAATPLALLLMLLHVPAQEKKA